MWDCRLFQRVIFVCIHLVNSFDYFWKYHTNIFQTQIGLHVFGDTCLYYWKKITDWNLVTQKSQTKWVDSSSGMSKLFSNPLPQTRQHAFHESFITKRKKYLCSGNTGQHLKQVIRMNISNEGQGTSCSSEHCLKCTQTTEEEAQTQNNRHNIK